MLGGKHVDKQKIKDIVEELLHNPRTWRMCFFIYTFYYVFMSAAMYYVISTAGDYADVAANIELNLTAIQNGTLTLQENTYMLDAWMFPLLFLRHALIGVLLGYMIGKNKK